MKPSFDQNEIQAMNNYMCSDGWMMEFKKTREFEHMISDYHMPGEQILYMRQL